MNEEENDKKTHTPAYCKYFESHFQMCQESEFGLHCKQQVGFVLGGGWTPPSLPFVSDFINKFYG